MAAAVAQHVAEREFVIAGSHAGAANGPKIAKYTIVDVSWRGGAR
jgi:hypothetical protein